MNTHKLRQAVRNAVLHSSRPWRDRRSAPRPVRTCPVTISHKVFVTDPPGYGSLVECNGDHRHGIAVTVGDDFALRDLDGSLVRPGRRPPR